MPQETQAAFGRWRPGSQVTRALASPARNLVAGIIFVLLVMVGGVGAYVLSGWSLGDAVYMVVLTVYTVGYNEVRPIDTGLLRAITIGLIVLGCTGMIFVTGALVQLITATQFSELLDVRRMNMRIDDLRNHVIICGYGRIGSMLARELAAANRPFIVVEQNPARCADAQAAGHLHLAADATDEASLTRAGIQQARALATVLHDDAFNVFITLSARSLNPGLMIIARGEAPTTERKLTQAGADRVVLPAHIGAERMAEILIFPELEDPSLGGLPLQRLGLSYDVVIAGAASRWTGLTVAEIERQADEAFLIVGVDRRSSGQRERATPQMRIGAGDGVMVVGRSTAAAVAGFAASA
jgi:voltage-gated potassium channel